MSSEGESKTVNGIKKRRKYDDVRYEFLPQMLEIVERPPHRSSVIIIISMVTLLITAVVWAGISKIDSVVYVTGVLTAKEGEREISATSSGVIQAINIKNGDLVSAGQELVVLDKDVLNSNIDELTKQFNKMQAQVDELSLIRENPTIPASKLLPTAAPNYPETEIIKTSHQLYLNSLDLNNKQQAELTREINNISAQIEQFDAEGRQQESVQANSLRAQYQESLEGAKVQYGDIKANYLQQILSQLTELESKLSQLRVDLEQANSSSQQLVVKAPISGVISQSATLSIDQPVMLGQKLFGIVPDQGGMEIELSVPDSHISKVKVGDKIKVTISAFPSTEYGDFSATVANISASATDVEGAGRTFRVVVEPEIEKNSRILLKPGMSVNAEISTGSKTVLRYLLDPIFEGLRKGIKE